MFYFFLCILVFLASYTLNALYITIFYHRGLTHRALTLQPWIKNFIVHTGNWVTGLDPKGWICMHRLHHEHSDTQLDPHSPVPNGIWKVLLMQLHSYRKTLMGLIHNKDYYTAAVRDLDFEVNWLNRKRIWYLPYLLHLSIAVAIGVVFHAWLFAGCYWVGMMSHPLQGWMVNALGHRFGYRNFELPDNSRNNRLVAWFVFGEGYQNNHHYSPRSASFSTRRTEVDIGYGFCVLLSFLRMLKINQLHPSL